MNRAQVEMISAIVVMETIGEVRSLFHVVQEVMTEYSYGWRTLAALEERGLVAVTRNGAGYPLTIRSTPAGRQYVHERMATAGDPPTHPAGYEWSRHDNGRTGL